MKKTTSTSSLESACQGCWRRYAGRKLYGWMLLQSVRKQIGCGRRPAPAKCARVLSKNRTPKGTKSSGKFFSKRRRIHHLPSIPPTLLAHSETDWSRIPHETHTHDALKVPRTPATVSRSPHHTQAGTYPSFELAVVPVPRVVVLLANATCPAAAEAAGVDDRRRRSSSHLPSQRVPPGPHPHTSRPRINRPWNLGTRLKRMYEVKKSNLGSRPLTVDADSIHCMSGTLPQERTGCCARQIRRWQKHLLL